MRSKFESTFKNDVPLPFMVTKISSLKNPSQLLLHRLADAEAVVSNNHWNREHGILRSTKSLQYNRGYIQEPNK